MKKEDKIMLLKKRRALLDAKGSHNSKIVAKLDRKIRALESSCEGL